MSVLYIAPERLPADPDFSTEHREMAKLYADALGYDYNHQKLLQCYGFLRRGDPLLVARFGATLAGIALLDSYPSDYTLEKETQVVDVLATVTAYRKKRIVGPALIEASIGIAAERGASAVELQAPANRVGFYERNGFEVVTGGSNLNYLRREI